MDVLASHSALLAIPAFVPALAVVGVVLVIAIRDRRAERRGTAAGDADGSGTAAEQHADPEPQDREEM